MSSAFAVSTGGWHDKHAPEPIRLRGTQQFSAPSASLRPWAAATGAVMLALTAVSPIVPAIERSWQRASPATADIDRVAVYDEILSYRSLTDGWDGSSSVAPTPAAINDALSFFKHLLPPNAPLPEPTVAADGEVGLFWSGPGIYVDIGFRGNGEISYYARVNGAIEKGRAPLARHLPLPKPLLQVLNEMQ